MKNKDLLAFGLLAIAGYLLWRNYDKKHSATETTDPMMAACKEKIEAEKKTLKLTPEAMANWEKQQIEECYLKSNPKYAACKKRISTQQIHTDSLGMPRVATITKLDELFEKQQMEQCLKA